MKRLIRTLLPPAVVLIGLAVAWMLIRHRPRVERVVQVTPPPMVRVAVAEPRPVRLQVRSQGTVAPRTASALVPEVSGRLVEVSSDWVPGGFFEAGDLLVRIDRREFELARARARAEVAAAEIRLLQEEAEAEVARREWEALGEGEPNPLTLRLPQMEAARTALAAARAAVKRAELDLERTELRAPFAGRVRERHVDVGQVVVRGAAIADLYAIDFAEVRLPIQDDEIAFIDLPLDYRGDRAEDSGPAVVLHADFGGRRHRWHGRIVRTEGEIDPRTRVVYAVARVEDPYGRGDDPDRPPLAVGMFVEAEIAGRTYDDLIVLPRTVMRDGDRVLVVDPDDRLRYRSVELLRAEPDRVLIRAGLKVGERVCITLLDTAVDGMRVRVAAAAAGDGGRP